MGARVPIVAGNWKMNTIATTARELIEGIKAAGVDQVTGVEKVVCPPFAYLSLAAELTRDTTIQVGGQDVHWEEKGAYTGEVSAAMLRDFASYVIIGHSERRIYFGETDDTVNRKLQAALSHDLIPIVCVGETISERQANQTLTVLSRQVDGALRDITLPPTAVIAYEPVWAIGTGMAATPSDANEAISFIRSEVARTQGDATAQAVRILYGGSVNAANVGEYVGLPEVDGGLVGGASLDAAAFAEMVRIAASLA